MIVPFSTLCDCCSVGSAQQPFPGRSTLHVMHEVLYAGYTFTRGESLRDVGWWWWRYL